MFDSTFRCRTCLKTKIRSHPNHWKLKIQQDGGYDQEKVYRVSDVLENLARGRNQLI
ncbi:hypothetical protein ZOSMA_33G00070 [Zostera marina]|uniref:Uncharacterized protein n=1 Tax=Zostera marina TaxID=29655 RepID=A0A0K9P7J0_ZOSMR|nr:hypothetical protein ZOSMA_33G00070 [Zostera marina]